MSGSDRGGFTLTELVIVMIIIGIISVIAVAKFAGLIAKADESTNLYNLGVIRSAVNIYYSSNGGVYPVDLAAGLSPTYMSVLPVATIPQVPGQGNPGHLVSRVVSSSLDDWRSGAWVYTNPMVFVNCTHNDTKGSIWSGY